MREIKFRVWRDGVMCKYYPRWRFYNNNLMWAEKDCPDENKIGKGEPILMQYTGLKDKNGKEIYEFDRVKGDWDVVNGLYEGTVEFYGGAFRIKETGLPICWAEKHIECEIVGNIFENPELLK